MKLALIRQAFMLLLAVLFIYSCNDNNTSEDLNDPNAGTEESGPATLSIKLVDDPGDFENLFIEVVDVMIKYGNEEEDDEDGGWISMGLIEPGIYDILELTGGVDLPLIENEEIEPGFLKQIRLVLGDQNSIVIDGEESDLMTPSAQQSGLKIKVDQQIDPSFNYSFILDFVVEESIVIAGNSGNIILKPVLRASLEATTGTISGVVLPGEVAVNVTADDGSTQVTAATDDSGNFILFGLPPGNYDLSIVPDSGSGYAEATVEDVSVTEGQNTDVGEIVLETLPGSISGIVLPADVIVEIVADNGGGSTGNATTDGTTGEFAIENLEPGIYAITLTPDAASGLAELIVDNVEVLAGQNTDLGEITLE